MKSIKSNEKSIDSDDDGKFKSKSTFGDYKLSPDDEEKYLNDAESILKGTPKAWKLKDLVEKVMKINNLNEFDFSTKAKILVAIRWSDRFQEYDQGRIRINSADASFDTEDDEIGEYFNDEDVIDFSHLAINKTDFFIETNQNGFDNTYIYLGYYPQSLVSDPILIQELKNTYKVKKNRVIELGNEKFVRSEALYSDNDRVFSNGEAPVAGKAYFFKIEPVKWRLLLKSSNKYMLTTEKLLLAAKYDDNFYVKFENSYIKNQIIPRLLNTIFGIKTDKCTFLHEDDIKSSILWTEAKNKSWIENRIAFPTDYAISQGAYSDEDGGLYWGFVSNFGIQSSIIGSGTMWANDYIIEHDTEFPIFDVCIRPVIKIKL